jgi:glc operon protein GlcG
MRCSAVTTAVLFAAVSNASAQVTQKPALSLDGAQAALAAAAAEARRSGAGGAIAVVDDGGHLLAFARLDGTFPAGAEVSIGKARTAAIFRKPTSAFEDSINKGRFAMTALPDFFTPLQGGVPIMHDGQVIGGIGVSGSSSAAQDEQVASAGAAGHDKLPGHADAGTTPSASSLTRFDVLAQVGGASVGVLGLASVALLRRR